MAKLLLIDDDRSLRDTLRDLLAEAGYAVATASHGGEMLESIVANPPDLVCATGACRR